MTNTIPFRNAGTLRIPGFGVMRCTGVEAVEGRLVLTMDQPNDTLERLYYVNGPTPVEADHFGQCRTLTGVDSASFPALYDGESATPEPGQSWGVKSGDWALFPGRYGFTVLGHPEHERVFVRQHELAIVEGKLAEALVHGGTAEVQVYGETGDTGLTITARDVMLDADRQLPEETYVIAAWTGGRWCIVSSSRCPEEA